MVKAIFSNIWFNHCKQLKTTPLPIFLMVVKLAPNHLSAQELQAHDHKLWDQQFRTPLNNNSNSISKSINSNKTSRKCPNSNCSSNSVNNLQQWAHHPKEWAQVLSPCSQETIPPTKAMLIKLSASNVRKFWTNCYLFIKALRRMRSKRQRPWQSFYCFKTSWTLLTFLKQLVAC